MRPGRRNLDLYAGCAEWPRPLVMPAADRNPYQALLARQLGELGVDVIPTRPSAFWVSVLRRVPNLIHLHWITRLVQGRGMVSTARRLARSLVHLAFLQFMGVRIVWTAHQLENHGNKHTALDRYSTEIVVRIADAIIAHSESCPTAIAEKFGEKYARKIFVVPHGNYIGTYPDSQTREDARGALGIDPDAFVVGFIGTVTAYKGIFELLEVMEKPSLKPVSLLIAGKLGDGVADVLPGLLTGRKNIRLEEGWVPDDRVQVYMGACDVVALPYREVFTSGAIMLAASFGKPIIAPRMGWIADTLDDAGSFLYDPDEPDGLLHALESALASKTHLDRMGSHNYRIAEELDWRMIAEKTLHVYKTALGTSSLMIRKNRPPWQPVGE